MNDDIRARASRAFDAEFRDELCNAVTIMALEGPGSVGVEIECWCPLECLIGHRRMTPWHMVVAYPRFGAEQFAHFMDGFDCELADTSTPEAALGRLYRERLG